MAGRWAYSPANSSALYAAYREGRGDPLPELALQYADYAAWQRRTHAGRELAHAAYWREALAGAPVLLELPADRPRPPQQEFAAGRVPVELDAQLVCGLKKLSERHGATLFMTLTTAWCALLSRLSGQDDVVIGTPVANRTRSEVGSLIGFFVNTLALRVDASGSPSVAELLARVKAQTIEAQVHQDLPFEQVVEIAQPPRSLSHTPLFTVMFAWQNNDRGDLLLPGLEVERFGTEHSIAKYDLTLNLGEESGTIAGEIEYAAALFDKATIERYAGYLRAMLAAMACDDRQPVDRVALLAEDECRQLVIAWNETQTPYPAGRCIHELFEERAARSPDAPAVVDDGLRLSYAQLNSRANALAAHLRGIGVRPGDRVALLLDRSIDLVASEIAVLKCGAIYVPLDRQAPAERWAFVMEDCEVRALLTAGAQRVTERPGVARVDVDRVSLDETAATNVAVPSASDDAAYIMYTSGSTGEPKGVAIAHRSIARLVLENGYAQFEASDRVAFAANPAFDASTMEVWAPLLNGGCIAIVAQDVVLDPQRFRAHLESHGVTVLWLSAGLFSQYADVLGDAFRRLRYLIAGGDVLDAGAVARVLRNSRPAHLLNGYGPTETTTFALTHEVTSVSEGTLTIPIGRPIGNTRAYVLDAALEPVPRGVTGELYIGGDGVALGYWNRPELTAQRFVESPFVDGDRLYATGDLVRHAPDGTLEFFGRNDAPSEDTRFPYRTGRNRRASRSYPGIRDAVVLAYGDGADGKRLVAYYTRENDGAEVDATALRAHLCASLPEYMVPSAYVQLETLPLNANGKLDRNALAGAGSWRVRAARVRATGRRDGDRPWRGSGAGCWRSSASGVTIISSNSAVTRSGSAHARAAARSPLAWKLVVRDLFAQPSLAEFSRVARSGGARARSRRSRSPIATHRCRCRSRSSGCGSWRRWTARARRITCRSGLRLSGDLDRLALSRALDRIVAPSRGAAHDVSRSTMENPFSGSATRRAVSCCSNTTCAASVDAAGELEALIVRRSARRLSISRRGRSSAGGSSVWRRTSTCC